MAVHQEAGTDFDQRVDQLVTGLDIVRQEYGVDEGRYQDDSTEDGPGAFFIVTDSQLDYFTKDAFDRARREKYDAVRRRLEADNVSDETYDAFMDLYESEFDGDEELRILGNTYLGDVDPDTADVDELYERIYETFEENDGAAVYGSDGFSDVTYDIPKLDFDGSAHGTKEATARGIVENPLYTPDGEEMEVRAVTLSETDGTIKVYGPDGFAEYGKNTPVPTREQPETEEAVRSDGGIVMQEL